METLQAIETGAKDTLNAGLGLFRTVEEKLAEIQGQIVANYNGLVSKGAADTSEPVSKLRNGLDQAIAGVKDVQTKVEAQFKN